MLLPACQSNLRVGSCPTNCQLCTSFLCVVFHKGLNPVRQWKTQS